MTVGGVDEHLPFGLEDGANIIQALPRQRDEVGTGIFPGRLVHRPQDPLRDISGAWGLKKIASPPYGHDRVLYLSLEQFSIRRSRSRDLGNWLNFSIVKASEHV